MLTCRGKAVPRLESVVEIYQGCRQSYEMPGAPRSNTKDFSIGGWRPLGFVSRALLMGYRLGFQASSDHISTHISYCNVYVEEPTRENILEAMKKRHVYGSTDNIIADVRCNGHFMGDEFETNEAPRVSVGYIAGTDFLMHEYGYDSRKYVDECLRCDEYIGRLVGALKETGRWDEVESLTICDSHGRGENIDYTEFSAKLEEKVSLISRLATMATG